ncbi:MAG: DUF2075 domain-containing protein [Erysipelotrichaceae bacterium]|nr:DUF2075 domain-containing protein [Erysipelotrichaceae bacterium]
MIAYNESLSTFYSPVNKNIIADKVLEKLNINVGTSERRAFQNSLPAIATALRNEKICEDAQIGIEFKVPLTNKRVDFIIAGSDETDRDHIIIVELKQWDKVEHTDMARIVCVEGREHVHPSWQSYTYSSTISSFNEYVELNGVEITPCTFLHNYERRYRDELCNDIYKEAITLAKPFITDEYADLAKFVFKYIKKGSKKNLLYEIDNGRIKPSKMLVDSLASMLNGNKEYELIDQQIIVYENLLKAIKKDQNKKEKQVFIIRGGAGTGKSLIAINLLASLINNKGYKAFYVAKSGYVRENYFKKLTKGIQNYSFLRTLFMSSSKFVDSVENEFDVLIVDEAHRLTLKSKQSWMYRGENQIKEIIHAAKTSVFFIDETQTIDIKDFGTIENIKKYAEEENATVHMEDKYILQSQFRCNGSDDYIAWIESVLYNIPYMPSFEQVTYDIKIFDDLGEMKKAIVQKNNSSNVPSRMLSGDVFEWKSRSDKSAIDIILPNFKAQWNKTDAFATDPKSINEVGCIHTSQGMEFEYVGLIVADDLLYRNGTIITDYSKHPKGANEFKRPQRKIVLEEDSDIIDRLIRNTYKVLFTRGQKGCYLYVMDEGLKIYLEEKIKELLREVSFDSYKRIPKEKRKLYSN